MKTKLATSAGLIGMALLLGMGSARAAVTLSDNFTGTNSTAAWAVYNGACLTAGTSVGSSSYTATASTSIPACGTTDPSGNTQVGGYNGTFPDPVGNGALRLTNSANSQKGAIISATPFSSGSGLQVTFTAVSYDGSGDGPASDGADGLSFFLLDASYFATPTIPTTGLPTISYGGTNGNSSWGTLALGSWGGSLAYTCSNSNSPYVGIIGGYIGLGMDEYGNFLNGSDNTAWGVSSAYQVQPNNNSNQTAPRIGLRGVGSIAWNYLNSKYPSYYPSSTLNTSSLQTAAVLKTCQNGTVWNYSSSTSNPTVVTTTIATSGSDTWATLSANYPYYYPASVLTTTTLQTAAVTATNTAKQVRNYHDSSSGSSTVPLTINDYMPLLATSGSAAAVNLGSSYPIGSSGTNATYRGGSAVKPISYKLTLTQTGLLSVSFSYNGGTYQPVITSQNIAASNGALPANLIMGFAGSTGGSRNAHEIICFQAAPVDISASSAGVNGQQSGQIKTSTQVYLAYYHATNWWGELTSQSLNYNSSTGAVTVSSTANWDASCVLTGGSCAATGGTNTAEASASRVILSYNGTTSAGIPFEWANLSSTEQSNLDSTAASASATSSTVLNYMRGDRTNEINSSGVGLYRARNGVLGDIVDSSPIWVGPPTFPYTGTWVDLLNPSTPMPENTTLYSNFITSQGTRTNLVYVGSNDGMVHGFRTGSYDLNNNYIGTYNDGYELLAYMPAAVLNTINNAATSTLDYANSSYAHNFFVDATPGEGDLLYNSAWHSWLVGGLGAGGNSGGGTAGANSALYVLDVTDPTKFTEANASTVVIGEWNPSTITCSNDNTCGTKMGNISNGPQVRRMHNGNWAVIFGNGLNSSSGKAGIFIMQVNNTSGAITFQYLDTGSTASGNGISEITASDLDADGITDYVYGGDVKGNMWRFDVTSSNSTSWGVSSFTSSNTGSPLFTSPSAQPITTRPMIPIETANSGAPRVMIDFGTGQQTVQTLAAATTYASGTQTLYGIWDWNMTNWNSLSSSTPLQSLGIQGTINALTNLTQQTVTYSINGTGTVQGYRVVSSNTVCWSGATVDCGTAGTKLGWYLNLPGTNEQVIYDPILAYNQFIVNTTIPASSSPLTCSAASASGWTMAINAATGGSSIQSFFPNAAGNFTGVSATVGGTSQVVDGIAISATGSPSIVTANNSPYLVTQTVAGTGSTSQVNPAATANTGYRLNWTQLR